MILWWALEGISLTLRTQTMYWDRQMVYLVVRSMYKIDAGSEEKSALFIFLFNFFGTKIS